MRAGAAVGCFMEGAMKKLEPLYQWLEQGPTPVCDRILAAGLEHAAEPYFSRLCEILLHRGHPASWGALAGTYAQLPAEMQQTLASDHERLRMAIAEAVKLPSAQVRIEAIGLLDKFPFPQLAYLLSDALRDPSKDVCRAAAQQLRKLAGSFLKRYPVNSRDLPKEVRDARGQLSAALLDALRTFDQHWRLEPVQAALWFATDLGDELWAVLANKRSQCRATVLERLEEWDDPRMAGFYLSALARSEWAPTAQTALAAWHDRHQVSAILHHVELLDDPKFAARLSGLRQIAWFNNMDSFLLDLPPQLRAVAPRWVFAAPLSSQQRTALLSRWLEKSCPRLRRACAYGLARLDNDDARRRLQQIARGTKAGSTFARWWLQGRQSGIAGGGMLPELRVPEPPQVKTGSRASADDATFDMLWQLMGRVPVRENGRLLQAFRAHLPMWQDQLVRKLAVGAPRDRLLALHVVATRDLVPRYIAELRELLNDEVQAIRELARSLIASASALDDSGVDSPPATEPVGPPPETSVAEAREGLLRYLSHLLTGQAMIDLSESAVDAITDLVRQYRAAVEYGGGEARS